MLNKKQISWLMLFSGAAIAIWTLLRGVLWMRTGVGEIGLLDTLKFWLVGAWFDFAALAYLLVPLLLLSLLAPAKWRQRRIYTQLRWGFLTLVVFMLIFGVVSEFIFWQEFTTRFNFIAVDYLMYTHEVIGNIKESYPVPLILLAIALVAGLVVFGLSRKYALTTHALSRPQKLWRLGLAVALPVVSYSVANVDQMGFSKNAYAVELSGNGVFSFSAAARRNELDYDKFYAILPAANAQEILAKLGVARFQAKTAPAANALGPFKRRPKNIVLVSVESLSAEYLGLYGNTQNLTPYLDKLANESLVFDKLFATGTRTVRGLDALSIGIPPIPGQAVVHRPTSDHLVTIGEVLRANKLETYFIYGGYGVFDNMNNYFKSNDYQVIDRTDFDPKTIQSENVWGVDDESLFDNSIQEFDTLAQAQKPFFAHIMTTSNHRPYTFPAGKIDLPQGRREGAVKYTDYALGQLIEKSKSKAWFKDTLFVIVADHCASVAGKTQLPVAKYHIPLFFYAPDMLPAGHYTRLASQIDIVPTLLDVLGVKGRQAFYGQSLFAAQANQTPERAFISNYQALGYYKNNTLIVLSPKQKVEAYHVDSSTLDSTPIKPDPNLLNEAIAYYQTANREFKSGALKQNKNPLQ